MVEYMKELAIIIPAYKSEYLKATLESFVLQTDNRFNIYIGNDNSPYDIYSVVKEFEEKLDITYVSFKENMGSKSLTKQWERCIELSNEKWIWLFSDDDLVSPKCVEVFYKNVNNSSKFYKFNTAIIDGKGKDITKKDKSTGVVKDNISSQLFLNKRLECKGFRSFAVEYIFHRSLYQNLKFVHFPLAWASDDASWLTYSVNNNGTITVLSSCVYWRLSGDNISSSVDDPETSRKKVVASTKYLIWLDSFCKKNDLKIDRYDMSKWLSSQIANVNYPVNYRSISNAFSMLENKSYESPNILKCYLYINYLKKRSQLTSRIKLYLS